VKRTIFPLMCLLLFLSGVASSQVVDVAVVINGEKLPPEPPPIVIDGNLFVPLRAIFIGLGAEVRSSGGKIVAQRGTRVVILDPKTGDATVDGTKLKMDVSPTTFEGTTYVPIRFVAQALGDAVAYDAKKKLITVTAASTTEEDPFTVSPERVSILKAKLKQLVVGNQGAILKVRNPSGDQEVYYRGLDDRDTAPYKAKDHEEILGAVGLQSGLGQWTTDTIYAFKDLPKREAIAFLGMVYSMPENSPMDIDDAIEDKVEEFLMHVVKKDKSVVLRRQAVLSMAVGDPGDPEVLEAVLRFYETSENLWETFPCQQYFQYHAEALRRMPNFKSIRTRVENVNSLYTANILQYLDGGE
jgi:Copper amine oxidase N-terminal domain